MRWSTATRYLSVLAAGVFGSVWWVGAEVRGAPPGGIPVVSGGSYHTLHLLETGELFAWGGNWSGQLGDGTKDDREISKPVGTDTDWMAISAGDTHSLAIKDNGDLYAWGDNTYGQLGVGDTNERLTPTLILSGVAAVSAGYQHSLIVKSDGSLWAMGNNYRGQLGATGPDTCSGRECSVSPLQVGSAMNWDQVAAGIEHSLAMTDTGEVFFFGRLITGGSFPTPTSVLTGASTVVTHPSSYSMAALVGGELYTWGDNNAGQLGHGDTTSRPTPTVISGHTTFDSVAMGNSHTIATKTDGSLWVWGANWFGQHGDQTTADVWSPKRIGTASDWASVTATAYGNLAMKQTTHELWGAGSNSSGELGDGTLDDRDTFVLAGVARDTGGPTGTIQTAGGEIVFNATSIDLLLSCTDLSGCDQMRFSDDDATWSTPVAFATTHTHTIPAGDGSKTIYVQFSDTLGNWSMSFSTTVTLDTTAPVAPVILTPTAGGISDYDRIVVAGSASELGEVELWMETSTNPTPRLVGKTDVFDAGSEGLLWVFDTVILKGVTHGLSTRTADRAGNTVTSAVTWITRKKDVVRYRWTYPLVGYAGGPNDKGEILGNYFGFMSVELAGKITPLLPPDLSQPDCTAPLLTTGTLNNTGAVMAVGCYWKDRGATAVIPSTDPCYGPMNDGRVCVGGAGRLYLDRITQWDPLDIPANAEDALTGGTASAINTFGEVAGYAPTGAAIWTGPGAPANIIGTAGYQAFDINDNAEIIGRSPDGIFIADPSNIELYGGLLQAQGWLINDDGTGLGTKRVFGQPAGIQDALIFRNGVTSRVDDVVESSILTRGMQCDNGAACQKDSDCAGDCRRRTGGRSHAVLGLNDLGQIVVHHQDGDHVLLTPTDLPPGRYDYSGEHGDPVNTRTGEFLYQPAPDLAVGGPMWMLFQRFYSSALNAGDGDEPLGNRWRHNYEWQAHRTSDRITIRTDRDQVVRFSLVDGVNWQPDVEGDYEVLAPPVVLAERSTGILRTFDSRGRLARVEDGHGAVHTLTYGDDTALARVENSYGNGLDFTYTNGLLTGVSDGTRSVAFGHDAEGDLTTVTTAESRVTTYVYDEGSHLIEIEGPDGVVELTNTYDDGGAVIAQLDALGEETTFAYDDVTGITTVTDPLSGVVEHEHDVHGALVAVTDEASSVVELEYDTSNRRTLVRGKRTDERARTYDPVSGRLTSYTDALGETWTYSYTARSTSGVTVYDLTGRGYPDGTSEQWVTDASGRAIQFVDRAGETWTYTYDTVGSLLTATTPLGGVTTYAYDADGRLETITDDASDVTTQAWDAHGRLVRVTYPDASIVEYTYDLDDHLLSVMDELGGTLDMTWTDVGQVATVQAPASAQVSFTYDDAGRLIETDDGHSVATVDYDEVGQPVLLTDPLGETRALTWDATGQPVSLVDEAGETWTYSYDEDGRMVQRVDPLGNATAFAHDLVGRITSVTSALGLTASRTLDAMGRTVASTDPAGDVTRYGYDARGELAFIRAPGNLRTALGRDAAGNLTAVADNDGNSWGYDYDQGGRLTGYTDPLGQRTAVAWDGLDRVSQLTYPDGQTQVLTRDAAGNPTRQQHSDAPTLDYVYDAAGRLTSADGLNLTYDDRGLITDSNGVTLAYDAAGQLVTQTFAPGKTVTYTYDAVGRLIEVADWTGTVTSMTWDAAGRRTGIQRSSGVETVYGWDADGRLTSVTEKAAQRLARTTLQLDDAGRVVSAARDMPEAASALASLDFDRPADVAGQVDDFSYDPRGRRVSDDRTTYAWDGASRLTGLVRGATSVAWTYDGLGAVLTRQEGSNTDEYVWNYALGFASPVVLRRSAADVRYFVHGPDGELLYSVEADGTGHRFYHYDERGNTLFLTNAAGRITDSWSYSPFGVVLSHSGSDDTPFTFAGRFGVMDEGGGLHRMRARVFDSRSAAFLTRDTDIEQFHPRAVLRYAYALNDPMGFVDPDGASPKANSMGGLEDQKKNGWKWGLEASAKAQYGLQKQIDSDALDTAEGLKRMAGKGAAPAKVAQATETADKLNKRKKAYEVIDTAQKVWKYGNTARKKGVKEAARELAKDTLEDGLKNYTKGPQKHRVGGSGYAGIKSIIETYKKIQAARNEHDAAIIENQRRALYLALIAANLERKGFMTAEQARTAQLNAYQGEMYGQEGATRRAEAEIAYQGFVGGIRTFLKTFTPF